MYVKGLRLYISFVFCLELAYCCKTHYEPQALRKVRGMLLEIKR